MKIKMKGNSMKAKIDSGCGLGTVLFLIFLVLKLCHVINWSWWWVFSPLWISAIIFLIIIAIVILWAVMK